MFYALLAIILMTLDFRGRWVDQIRAGAGLMVEPAVLLISAPYELAVRARHGLQSHRQLLAESRELRLALTRVSAELLLLEELALENAELRDLLEASVRAGTAFQAAQIRSVDLNPFSHRVLIDRGRRDGLARGNPVIDAHGVVGQIDEVFLHSARVILLTDPDHALPVRVQRTGLRTIAYGSGLTTQMRLNDLPMNVDLEPDDLLVTSGLGGVFPAGLPVARVEALQRPSGEAFARATLRPLGRLDRSRHLLVLNRIEAVPEEPDEPPDDEESDLVEDAAVVDEASVGAENGEGEP